MTSRTRREWALTGAVLIGVPMLLCGAFVAVFVTLVGGVSAVTPFDCARADWQLAEDMTSDAVAQELLARFPEGPEPHEGCDEDDRTVSAAVERRTGLSREEVLGVGADVLQRNGWRDLGRCYVKEVGGRKIWAELTYRDEYRSDPDSDLLLSMVSVRYAACRD